MADADRCLAFMRAFAERRAGRIVPFRFGRAYFDDELPRAPDLNAVEIGVEAPVDDLLREVERLQAGLEHRLVWVDDDGLGERLAGGFVSRGWKAVTNLVMVKTRPGREVETRPGREVDADTLVPLWAAGIARAPGADDEVVRQLVAAQLLRRKAVRVRYFAVLLDDRPVSYCELFSDGATGQVESVLTLDEHRGNGYASAVAAKAAAESQAMGHDVTFLTADEDDWPKELYAKLGFETVTRVWDFAKGALV